MDDVKLSLREEAGPPEYRLILEGPAESWKTLSLESSLPSPFYHRHRRSEPSSEEERKTLYYYSSTCMYYIAATGRFFALKMRFYDGA